MRHVSHLDVVRETQLVKSISRMIKSFIYSALTYLKTSIEILAEWL